jgi:hypothetical protein
VSGTGIHFLSLPQYNLESSFTCATGATHAWAGDDPKNERLPLELLRSAKHKIFIFIILKDYI